MPTFKRRIDTTHSEDWNTPTSSKCGTKNNGNKDNIPSRIETIPFPCSEDTER
jgi:hypothetical protein